MLLECIPTVPRFGNKHKGFIQAYVINHTNKFKCSEYKVVC
jgi:hypothetical protein